MRSKAQRRALLHLYGERQHNRHTGRRWYPSRGTLAGLVRRGLVTYQDGSAVLTGDGVAAAIASIPY